MKKILLVSNMYPSKKYPHYGVFVKNVGEMLSEKNKVKVIFKRKQDNKFIKLLGYFVFYSKIVFKGIFTKYDVIYGHFASHIALPLLIVKKFRRKSLYVINVHGNDVVPVSKKDFSFQCKTRKLLKIADYCIAPSYYFKQILNSGYGVPSERIFVSPSGGINDEVFNESSKNKAGYEEFGLNEALIYIGYVSRLEKDKGWDIFVELAKKINDKSIGFIMVGGGEEAYLCDELIKKYELQEKVKRINLVSQKELAKLYRSMKIFVFPTQIKQESLGLVGLEAMACGCIVVSSNMGGPSSYMEDGKNGFVCHTGEVGEYLEKIKLALELKPEELVQMKQRMKETVAKYDSKNVKEQLIEFFEKI